MGLRRRAYFCIPYLNEVVDKQDRCFSRSRLTNRTCRMLYLADRHLARDRRDFSGEPIRHEAQDQIWGRKLGNFLGRQSSCRKARISRLIILVCNRKSNRHVTASSISV